MRLPSALPWAVTCLARSASSSAACFFSTAAVATAAARTAAALAAGSSSGVAAALAAASASACLAAWSSALAAATFGQLGPPVRPPFAFCERVRWSNLERENFVHSISSHGAAVAGISASNSPNSFSKAVTSVRSVRSRVIRSPPFAEGTACHLFDSRVPSKPRYE